MSNWKISRRNFISSSGSIFLLPLLESLVPTLALAAAADPRRFIGMYMPNGTYNRNGDAPWHPATGALGTNLGLVLDPFAANKSDFSILKGIKMSARQAADNKIYAFNKEGGAHVAAHTTFLTGQILTDPGAKFSTVPGSSFDQLYAQFSGKPVLVVSGGADGGAADSLPYNYSPYLSFKDGKVVEPNRNPVFLFNQMFASLVPSTGPTPPPTAQKAVVRNRSILDSSLADINDLKSKLGKTDNIKLDQHFTSLRDLEQRLLASQGSTPTPTSQCKAGSVPPSSLDNSDRTGRSQNYVQRVQAFMDMIVLGFQCDIIRSVSFMYDGEVTERNFNAQIPTNLIYGGADLTGVGDHEGISHYSQNPAGREKCITRDRFYMHLMMYLVNKLKASTDPSGSPILDNTIILNGHGVADGSHSDGGAAGVPIIIGGGRNFLNPGFSYDASTYDLKDLIYTFSTHLGMGLGNFVGNSKIVKV